MNEALQNRINESYSGDRSKLIAELPEKHSETMGNYRQTIAEEVILQAMLARETKRPKNGHPPPTKTEWLASLRKGIRVQMIKTRRGQGESL